MHVEKCIWNMECDTDDQGPPGTNCMSEIWNIKCIWTLENEMYF